MPRRILDWFHRVFGSNRRAVEEVVTFCHALTVSFEDRLPNYLRHNTPVRTGWWAISLYVQLPLAIPPGRLTEGDVDYACGLASDHLTAWLTGSTEIDTSEIRAAFPAYLRVHWNLWNSAFGFPPDHETLQDFDTMFARLQALLDDDQLNLRNAFHLPVRADPDELDVEGPDEEELADAGDELCEAYALFFDICSRSRP